MKVLIWTLVTILLAIPVALLVIFDTPGLGILLAIIFVWCALYYRAQRTTTPGKAAEAKIHNDVMTRKAA